MVVHCPLPEGKVHSVISWNVRRMQEINTHRSSQPGQSVKARVGREPKKVSKDVHLMPLKCSGKWGEETIFPSFKELVVTVERCP